MRQLAERLLPEREVGTTFVDKEIVNQKIKPLKAPKATFHIYCSELNPGAQSLMTEVTQKHGINMQIDGGADRSTKNTLYVTNEAANLPQCDHVLLYLTSQTWTRGEQSAKLGVELTMAQDLGIHIRLAHEMTGAGGQ